MNLIPAPTDACMLKDESKHNTYLEEEGALIIAQ